MAPTLYMVHPSPPARAVMVTAKAISLQLDEKEVDFFGGEHLRPEYLKINPQHTVPALVDDDGFAIWDSHAIMSYLIFKYAKNDSLYPIKDPKRRAIIDQRLHFDSGIMCTRLFDITRPTLKGKKTTIDDADKEQLNEAYAFLEAFLKGNQWVAGDTVSIADYSLYTTVSSIHTLIPVDSQKYPNVTAWMKRAENLPEFEVNKKGVRGFEELFKSKLIIL